MTKHTKSDVAQLQRDAFRHVESELYAYPYRKREIERLRSQILNPYKEPEENTGGSRSNLPGDPTARAGISLASHSKLIHMERVVDAIEEVYNRLPEVKQELIQAKYWTKPQHLTTVGICKELSISESTYRRWRSKFVRDIVDILGW
ncbi:transcriptional activator [Paenibacillus senegalensis]|uniref:transcriptional activator n=1 Tax=Paenibacillus senegalensis TaxID=1465766 RepID=UPI0002880837|nr:transcriptional activator [Paenibacillus senegalensis]